MKLKGIKIDKNGEFRLMRFNIFVPDVIPEIILTEEEAKERGFNPNHKKGYYTEVEGVRVPINIKKNKNG